MSRRAFIAFILFFVVGIILIYFGIYLINCCSYASPLNGDLWYYLVKYVGFHFILIGVGGMLIILDLIGGLYFMRKSSNKE